MVTSVIVIVWVLMVISLAFRFCALFPDSRMSKWIFRRL